MSDLADTIDDLICSFESDGKTTMDTLIMYLFCWALVGFVALAAGKYAYSRALAGARSGTARAAAAAATTAEPSTAADRKQQTAKGAVPPTPPASRKRLGSKTGRTSAAVAGVAAGLSAVPAAAAANRAFSREPSPHHHHHQRPKPCRAAGNDPDAVRWTDDAFQWLYNDAGEPSVLDYLSGEWIRALNEYTKKSFAEVSVPRRFSGRLVVQPDTVFRSTGF